MTDSKVSTVELTPDAASALNRYIDALNAVEEAHERREKARSDLLSFLAVHNATLGTVDGRPVIQASHYDRETVDTQRFRTEEPFMYRRFTKLTRVEALRLRGAMARPR